MAGWIAAVVKPGPAVHRSNPVVDPGRRGGAEGAAEGPAAGVASEEELVRRARAGDGGAFRALVERHADRVHALTRRIVFDPAEAEEVAQDAFVRAWRALPRFAGRSAFATWIYRIAARCAFDRAAILRRRRSRERPLAALGPAPAAVPGPDAEATWRRLRLERAMLELTSLQRAVLALYHGLDRSVAETARVLGLPENTVKTHLRRGRAALREAWLRLEDDT